MKTNKAISAVKTYMDGFFSAISSIGTARDKAETFQYSADHKLSKAVIDALYARHELAWKIIDLLPDSATRKWFEIDHEESADLMTMIKESGLQKCINRAGKKDRKDGGCAVYMPINDGQDTEFPVNRNSIHSIGKCQVFEAEYISPVKVNRSGNHELYQIQTDEGLKLYHVDRLLIFEGAEVSDDWRLNNNGWGESILNRVYRPLIAYSTSHGQVPRIIQDFIQGVISIKGLNELVDTDNEAGLKARFEALVLGKSVVNDLVIDADDNYSKQTTSIAGLNDLIRNPEKWLVAASGIPNQKLLGQSEGTALSSGGESQNNDWQQLVGAYQEDKLREPIEKAVGYFGDLLKITEPLEVIFKPLGQPTEKQKAETHKIQAEADNINLLNNIVTAPEVRESRFGGREFSTETKLNEQEFAALEKLEREVEAEVNGNQNNDPPD